MDTNHAQAWIVALNRYLSAVHHGGTPEQRAWAWARANDALDKHLNIEHALVTKAETQELEAVKPDTA